MLGTYFTGNVQTVAQPVIERGAYGYVRHPSYTAGMMMFLGIGLAPGSWLNDLLCRLGWYMYRVGVEERVSPRLGERLD